MEKCDKEGADAVSREDLDRLARLHDALKKDLEGMEGYMTLRGSIDTILTKPEEPPFLFKGGAKGFLRGRGPQARVCRISSIIRDMAKDVFYTGYCLISTGTRPISWISILRGRVTVTRAGTSISARYSLYQGYVEGKLPGSEDVALKVGRQEIVYGSAFILGQCILPGPHIRCREAEGEAS